LLVGTNNSVLGRLEGVDLPRYKATVLPAILDQVVSCHDVITQKFLADCIAQVFQRILS
jgi:vacuolar protein sorting-associated protein 35